MLNINTKYYIRTYEYAQWIRNTIIYDIEDEDVLYFFQLDEPIDLSEEIIVLFLKPNKYSYLHDFIDRALQISFEYESRKYAEPDEWNKLTSAFLGFEIEEKKFNSEYEDYKETIENKIIKDILPRITDEVFSILFYDKEFLLQFNLFVAKKLKEIDSEKFPKLFNSKGYVNRVSYWPKWLEKGLFYRDRGRCSYCFKDISGLLNIENKLNIDHIIPLANGGTNDTCNCQLLCENCNNKKRAKVVRQKEFKYFRPY